MTIDSLRFISSTTSSRTIAGNTPFEISVVVPTHARPYQVPKLLETILNQRNAPHYEILVVSNLIDPVLERCLASLRLAHPHLRLLAVGRVGVNSARNLGISKARGKVILFVDDDCRMNDPEFLRKHFDAHLQYPQCAGIGGFYTLPTRSSVITEAYHLTSVQWLECSRIDGQHSLHLVGGNSSFKREYFDGSADRLSFDERIEFGGSETELQYRIARHGYKLLLLDHLEILHDCRVGPHSLLTKAYKQGRTSAKIQRQAISLNLFLAVVQRSKPSKTLRVNRRLSWRVRAGLWLYGLAFELGESESLGDSSQAPTMLRFFRYFLSREFKAIAKLQVLPVLREILYILRLSFKGKRQN